MGALGMTPALAATRHRRPARRTPPESRDAVTYLGRDQDRHLLRRATYGVTPEALAEVKRIGASEWLDRQLEPESIPDPVCDRVLRRLPGISAPIWAINAALNGGSIDGWSQMMNVTYAHIARAAWSQRQLLAIMEDFWSNHFNVTCPFDGVEASRADYANVIRKHALGRFADLLPAASMHPSMLIYMGTYLSTAANPNENQGRELLELHTVGVNAEYGQAGVESSSRILTGLSVSSDSGEFLYEPWKHRTGHVRVLGFSSSNHSQTGGLQVALDYFDYLAHHPDTARHLASEIAIRFVSDNPSEGLIRSLAKTYLAHDTAIAPVLRALFASEEFAASIGAKTQRPFQHLMAVLRALGRQPDRKGIDGLEGLAYMASTGGDQPLAWPVVNGYPDVAGAWATTAAQLSIWNQTLSMANLYPNTLTGPELSHLLWKNVLPANHGKLLDVIATNLLGRPLIRPHAQAILNFLGVHATTPVEYGSGAVTWQLSSIIALMLDSPYLMYR
jgi:uncharacterized protein (DUF1800 family)